MRRLHWTRKPSYGARVDPAHPLSSHLRASWLFNESAGTALLDSVGGRHSTVIGDTTNTTRWLLPLGYGLGVGANTGGTSFPGFPAITNAMPWALEIYAALVHVASDYRPLFMATGSLNGVYLMSSGKLNLYRGSDQLSTTTVSTAGYTHIVLSSTTAGVVTLYLGGVADATAFTAPTSWTPNTWFREPNVARIEGFFEYIRWWDRALTQGEVQQLRAAPFAMYDYQSRRRVKPAAAAAGRTTKNTRSHPLGIYVGRTWRAA